MYRDNLLKPFINNNSGDLLECILNLPIIEFKKSIDIFDKSINILYDIEKYFLLFLDSIYDNNKIAIWKGEKSNIYITNNSRNKTYFVLIYNENIYIKIFFLQILDKTEPGYDQLLLITKEDNKKINEEINPNGMNSDSYVFILTKHNFLDSINDLLGEYIKFDTTKANGQFKKTADTTSLAKLNHNINFTDIKDGLKTTIEWFCDYYDSDIIRL
jgi:hypothetical protein